MGEQASEIVSSNRNPRAWSKTVKQKSGIKTIQYSDVKYPITVVQDK